MRSVLISFVTAAVAVVATPVAVPQSHITLPLAKVFSFTGAARLAEIDRARAKTLVARSQSNIVKNADGSPVTTNITNTAVSYVANVGVGTPPTFYNLIVDTGSSNTWVGANAPYVTTPSSSDTGNEVEVEYGSGLFFGEEYIDTVTIGSLVIENQSIGGASEAFGFNNVNGILGLGPIDLTVGTLFPDSSSSVPTVTDNAFDQGSIPVDSVGIFFQPIISNPDTNGELTFGGVDDSKLDSEITYTPITETSPASDYWGIDQSIFYGDESILGTTAGIVDTGTTLILLASDAFAAYQEATGATQDQTTGLLTIDQDQFDSLQTLSFFVEDEAFLLTPNAQIWPRSLNTAIGGSADSIYLIVSNLGTPSGQGLDFINGQTFLERFYSHFDTTNKRVGLAYTQFTFAETN
ncbi:hypothetical protein EIP86_003299 [Pleurotus ostreatoroseus]|nr:hypothetical protein EIP86_003299 [Pleurotus ostreatoroseus]